MDEEELYAEMTLLVSAIARELGLSINEAVEGIEKGSITVSLETDPNGERYLAIQSPDKKAIIHQSALGSGGCSGCCQGDCSEEECACCEEEGCDCSKA